MISRKQLLSDKIKTGGWNFRLNGIGYKIASLEIKKKLRYLVFLSFEHSIDWYCLKKLHNTKPFLLGRRISNNRKSINK